MVSGFNHTGIVVRDVQKMVTFYTDVLGLKKLREIDSVAPPTGDHTGVPGARRKLVFVGFVLSGKGVRFVTEPKFRDTPNGRVGIVYARDPEGNWLEFIQAA